MRFIPVFLITIFLSPLVNAQNLPDRFPNHVPLPLSDTNALYLSVDNANFFKNNEYFNDYVAGYTRIGYFLKPTLTYNLSAKTRVSGGIHLLKYFGESGFNKIRPVFYLEHQLLEGFNMIMGSIRGTNQHHLIDPLYHDEKYLDEHTENGLQFLIKKPWIESDVWLNWKRFITEDSDFQERFETGVSSKLQLYSQNNFNIKLPLQVLIQHRGGQIGTNDEPVSTLSNFAAGPLMELKLHSRYMNSLAWENLYVGYRNLSPGKRMEVQSGHAFLTSIFVNMNDFQLQFSGWKANSYLSFSGNPIYQVYSYKKQQMLNDDRELVIGKLRYNKRYQDLQFMINFDTYWEPGNRNFDYGFGLYLLLNTNLFLTRTR